MSRVPGSYILTTVDGKAQPVTVEEYKQALAAKLVGEAPTLDAFRERWVNAPARRDMLARLPDGGRSVLLVRSLEDMDAYDLYDVLAELGYGMAPRNRADRAEAFTYKQADWLGAMPPVTAAAVKAITRQFALAGTEGLENPTIFVTSDVRSAGGLSALKALGKPAEVLHETKERMFAA